MTKKDAAEKVAKLRKIADDPRSPPTEAANARRVADRLVAEHSLTSADLDLGKLGAAHDDLLGEVEKIVKNNPKLPTGLFGTEKIVADVLGKLKNIDDSDKAARLRTFVGMVRMASFVFGTNPTVAEIKAVTDTVLKNHGVVL